MLSFCLSACGSDQISQGARLLPDDQAWESPHFAYHSRSADTAMCRDILATLERHFNHLQSMLGFVWPAGQVIH
ncbi:MAG TPA: hypothetical protein VF518_08845 [Polyangia bacterium]